MVEKSVILKFPRDSIEHPYISEVIRDREVEVNILQAYITPQEAGHMFAIFKGEEASVEGALEYLRGQDVQVVVPGRNLIWEESLCVHCSACTGQCKHGALTMNPETFTVSYDGTHCIACKLCIPACSYGALESVSDHLRRIGEL